MNPDESFRRLEDPDNWTFRLDKRADLVPARRRWSPLVLSFATIAAVAVAGIVVFSVFGLGIRGIRNPAAPLLPTTSSSSSPSAVLTPPPPPISTLGSIGDASCTNLLDTSTRTYLKKNFYTSIGDSWTGRSSTFGQDAVFSISDEKILGLEAFTGSGGIACRWDIDGGSDAPIYYAYGPISDADAAVAKTALAKDGTKVLSEGITRYVTSRPDSEENTGSVFTGEFAFSANGYWAFGYSPGFEIDALAEVLKNAPSFDYTFIAGSGPALILPASVNCTQLLDASSIQSLRDLGYVEQSSRARSQVQPFANGIHCIWAPKPDPSNGTDAAITYGFGPMTADESTDLQLDLTELGDTVTKKPGVTIYQGDDGTELAFGDNYWATAFINGGPGGIDYLAQVLKNAPPF